MANLTFYAAAEVVQRLAALVPNEWASEDAKQRGVAFAMLDTISQELAFITGNVQYIAAAARLQTATSPELDEAADDFFGVGMFPRPPGVTDAVYSALIIANLFQEANTRAAISAALLKLTGEMPRLMEPWNVIDTGAWGNNSYWNVDSVVNPARWGNGSIRYQGFIETVPPSIPAIGPNNPILTWGTSYWNIPGYFFGIIQSAPTENLYTLIDTLKSEGVLCWVKLTLGSSATSAGPAPVGNLVGTAGSTSVSLTWTAPASGSPPFSYTAFYRPTGTTSWLTGPTVSGNSATVQSLAAGQSYDFEVIVRNSMGQAASSIIPVVTQLVPPGPATNLRALAIGDTDVNLSWSPPTVGTPPFTYRVQYRVTGTQTWTQFGSAGNYTSIDITGLQPSTTYDFEVITSNIGLG